MPARVPRFRRWLQPMNANLASHRLTDLPPHAIHPDAELQRLIAGARIGMIVLDASLIVEANDGALRVFGCDRDDLCCSQLSEWVARESHQLLQSGFRSGFLAPYIVRGLSRNGATFSLEIEAKARLHYHGRQVVLAAVREVGEFVASGHFPDLTAAVGHTPPQPRGLASQRRTIRFNAPRADISGDCFFKGRSTKVSAG